jgi:hypothetical protein
MKMEDRPEKIMAMKTLLRVAGGKLRARLAEDQSSMRMEATIRIGMVRRLL